MTLSLRISFLNSVIFSGPEQNYTSLLLNAAHFCPDLPGWSPVQAPPVSGQAGAAPTAWDSGEKQGVPTAGRPPVFGTLAAFYRNVFVI